MYTVLGVINLSGAILFLIIALLTSGVVSTIFWGLFTLCMIGFICAIAVQTGNDISSKLKQCPSCAEDIKFKAVKCKHCGESVE